MRHNNFEGTLLAIEEQGGKAGVGKFDLIDNEDRLIESRISLRQCTRAVEALHNHQSKEEAKRQPGTMNFHQEKSSTSGSFSP
jgi:hypothetical protein